jgi:group I intron endonuclease
MVINNLTEDVYIGKSTRSLQSRKSSHIYQANKKMTNSIFHKALLKYGESSFDWIILEESDVKNLSSDEIFWIAYFRSIGAKLYNLTSGGEGGIGNKNAKGHKMSEESKERMKKALHGNKNGCGYVMSLEKRLSRSKTYIFTDPNGNTIVITNLAQFCRDNNLVRANMLAVYAGRRNHCKGWTKSNEI